MPSWTRLTSCFASAAVVLGLAPGAFAAGGIAPTSASSSLFTVTLAGRTRSCANLSDALHSLS